MKNHTKKMIIAGLSMAVLLVLVASMTVSSMMGGYGGMMGRGTINYGPYGGGYDPLKVTPVQYNQSNWVNLGLMNSWGPFSAVPMTMGMMGRYGYGNGYGYGMMGSGMMGGYGYGFEGCPMSGYSEYPPFFNNKTAVNSSSALTLAEKWVSFDSNLAITEVIEYPSVYHMEIIEKDTGTGAFMLLVNKQTGAIYPEMGAAMMWNTKYGMHDRYQTENMSIVEEKAKQILSEFINKYDPGLVIEDKAMSFYGFYEFHTTLDGKPNLSFLVNGYTGSVVPKDYLGIPIKIVEV